MHIDRSGPPEADPGRPRQMSRTLVAPEPGGAGGARALGLAGLALSIGLLAALLSGCGADGAPGTGEARAGDDARFQRVINVETRVLESTSFEEVIRITGTVQANHDVTVSAEEAGVVREIVVDRGSRVREGDPVVRIDDRMLRSQVREAEARAALARETWERRKRLFEDDGVGSELAYLEARYQAEQAEAALATLQERLDRTVVRAPLDGVLEERLVEVGTMVSAGTPVGRIVQVDPVKVVGGVPERYAEDVARGSRARVTFDALGGQETEARVGYVASTVNPQNRTFEVEFLAPNPGRTIKPEMVATVRITRRVLDDAIVVPQNAVVRVEEGFVAFVAEEDEGGRATARVRPLTLGSSQRNLVVVREGLRPGDRLIVVGQQQVADGDRIRVVGVQEDGR